MRADSARPKAESWPLPSAKQPVKQLPCPLADLRQLGGERLITHMRWCPASDQIREDIELHLGRRQSSGGLAGPDPQTVIDSPIKRGRIAEEIGVFALKMTHLLDHIDTLGSVQDLVEDAGPLQPQIHQGEIDVVVAAAAGLQRIAC